MSDVVVFNTQNTRVLDYLRSVNTPDFEGRPDVLINPDVTTLIANGVNPKYWKVVNSQVVEMTQGEKDYLDGMEQQDLVAQAKALAKSLQASDATQERLMRAIVKLTVDQLNLVRGWTNSFKTVVASSATLADIKSGVAGLNTFQTLTYQNAKDAINALIDNE